MAIRAAGGRGPITTADGSRNRIVCAVVFNNEVGPVMADRTVKVKITLHTFKTWNYTEIGYDTYVSKDTTYIKTV